MNSLRFLTAVTAKKELQSYNIPIELGGTVSFWSGEAETQICQWSECWYTCTEPSFTESTTY